LDADEGIGTAGFGAVLKKIETEKKWEGAYKIKEKEENK